MLNHCTFLSAAAVCALGFAHSASAVPVVIMDATTNNGSFTFNADDGTGTGNGFWRDSLVSTPAGWTQEWFNTNAAWTQNSVTGNPLAQGYYGQDIVNNTGELVSANTIYSLTANVNANISNTVTVQLIATENSDGTGASVLLTQASTIGVLLNSDQTGGYPSFTGTPPLLPIANASAATQGDVDGFYLKVRGTKDVDFIGYYFVDDIVVTSEVVPEPASLALLALGGIAVVARRQRAVR